MSLRITFVLSFELKRLRKEYFLYTNFALYKQANVLTAHDCNVGVLCPLYWYDYGSVTNCLGSNCLLESMPNSTTNTLFQHRTIVIIRNFYIVFRIKHPKCFYQRIRKKTSKSKYKQHVYNRYLHNIEKIMNETASCRRSLKSKTNLHIKNQFVNDFAKIKQ